MLNIRNERHVDQGNKKKRSISREINSSALLNYMKRKVTAYKGNKRRDFMDSEARQTEKIGLIRPTNLAENFLRNPLSACLW